jgi:LacI family transcriptional regulator
MTTLRHIARKAAVSTATVSNVLNDSLYVSPELRERVLAAVRELNYRPNTIARSLRVKRTHTVGMIVPDVTNPFFPAVVRGAEDVLARAGFTLVIGNSDNNVAKEETYYRTFLERQVDGLLTVPTSDEPPQVLKSFRERSIPVVYVDRSHTGMPGDTVMADNQGGSEKCVRHLAARGYRRIATITGPLHLANARARLEGYRRALKLARLPYDKKCVREGSFDTASGGDRTKELLSLRPRPDAIFVANALMVCGALEALHEAQLSCPEGLALACFDELDFFELLKPRLTCVAAPTYDLGARGADLLLKRISGKSRGPGRRYILRTKLIQRESSARAVPGSGVPLRRKLTPVQTERYKMN